MRLSANVLIRPGNAWRSDGELHRHLSTMSGNPFVPTRRQRAFTLTQLLLAIAVLAVLGAVSAPGLGRLSASLRLHTEINALHHAFHRGRREAIKRNAFVVLCQTNDGVRCDHTLDWRAGWMLYVETAPGRSPTRDASELRLLYKQVPESVRLTANRRYFALRTRRYRDTNGTLLACDSAGRVAGKALIVSYTGRPRARPEADLGGRLRC